jgi:two-component system, chemotaxis family, response regulator WspF
LGDEMKIAIVNDRSTAVAAMRQAVQTVPGYQVIWTAQDGAEAIARCAQNQPDLILMNLLMPVMDGVEATRQIMEQSPCGILIMTADREKQIDRVYKAMCHGALDVVDAPVMNNRDGDPSVQKLLSKIATLQKLLKPKMATHRSKSNSAPSSFTPTPPASPLEYSSFQTAPPPLIAIGASTGGPKALATVLAQLPANFGAAIAVVQHVDVQFSAGLASWLNQQINLPVRIAKEGNRLEPGTVTIAGSNDHLCLKPNLTLGYTQIPIDYPYRPSVDVFFKSLAVHWRKRGTAVLLTGMGRDGAEGLETLRSKGWHTIAQNQESCVVYGMPKAAVELNAAVEVLSLDAIALTLLRSVKLRR